MPRHSGSPPQFLPSLVITAQRQAHSAFPAPVARDPVAGDAEFQPIGKDKPRPGWADIPRHGLRLAAKTCESQDAGTGPVSSRGPHPEAVACRSIWISATV